MKQNARGEVRMGLADFKSADYGRTCQALGLRPSRPDERADGTRAPRRRGKRKKG